MVYIDSIELPSNDEVWHYADFHNAYPYTLFRDKVFERIDCCDIVMFCGSNGSGKSTLLNLLGESMKAERNSPLFVDEFVDRGEVLYPFHDFARSVSIRAGKGKEGQKLAMPNLVRLITSDGVFQKIEDRVK